MSSTSGSGEERPGLAHRPRVGPGAWTRYQAGELPERARERVRFPQLHRLTGPEALTALQQDARLAALLGRPLEYVEAPREAAAAAMAEGGLPPAFAAGLLDAQADPDPRRGGRPLPTVERLTGRPVGTFDAWLVHHLDLFGAPSRG